MRFFTLTAACALAIASQVSATSDIDTLNYALTLENLEAAYYNAGMAMFNTESAFASSIGNNPNYAGEYHASPLLRSATTLHWPVN